MSNWAFSKVFGRRCRTARRRLPGRLLACEPLEARFCLGAGGCGDGDQAHLFLDQFGNEYNVLTSLPVSQAVAGDDGTLASEVAAPTLALDDTFYLHSNPGANHTIYLDFDGHTTSGTVWNSSFNGGAAIVTPRYDFDGDASSFSSAELERIQYIWQRTSEDFLPFDVDMTTEDPGAAALSKGGGGDSQWGVRIVIGGSSSDWYGAPAGGVAYVGSFNWSSDTPAFIFEDQLANGNEKYTTEAVSHETGHTLGLRHDGRTSPSEEYYAGYGSGATGWAPIMGVGYYKSLTQWSKGEYLNANNHENDLAVITSNNGFGYRADDHGDTMAGASSFTVVGSLVSGSGIIEQYSDDDFFVLTTGAGQIDLSIVPAARGPNLDILAQLYDGSHTLIASANPADLLGASINTVVADGQYYLRVTGVGKGDPLADGYTDYGSLGSYSISGTVVVAEGDYLAIAAADAAKPEGNSGSTPFTFAVTRSGDTSDTTTVDYTVIGSGTNRADADDFAAAVLPSGSIEFAPGETSKTITIFVRGDTVTEDTETFSVVLSNASGDTKIITPTAGGTILDDDIPGIAVNPTGGLVTNESGTTASFAVVLDTRPSADVLIKVNSGDATEGTLDRTVLTFTPANWNVAQTVTVTGVDDTLKDRNVSYTIDLGTAQSDDAHYNGIDPDDVEVTNQDNDKKGKGGDKRRNVPKHLRSPWVAGSTLVVMRSEVSLSHHNGAQTDTLLPAIQPWQVPTSNFATTNKLPSGYSFRSHSGATAGSPLAGGGSAVHHDAVMQTWSGLNHSDLAGDRLDGETSDDEPGLWTPLDVFDRPVSEYSVDHAFADLISWLHAA